MKRFVVILGLVSALASDEVTDLSLTANRDRRRGSIAGRLAPDIWTPVTETGKGAVGGGQGLSGELKDRLSVVSRETAQSLERASETMMTFSC